jgi:hypothetical protein
MRKCVNCGHPKGRHGKGMLERRGYCTVKDEGQLAPCPCLGFVDPFSKMSPKEKVQAIIGERKEVIASVLRQRLEEEEIEISDNELRDIIWELFDEEKIFISDVPS